jgi:hypothetical protein
LPAHVKQPFSNMVAQSQLSHDCSMDLKIIPECALDYRQFVPLMLTRVKTATPEKMLVRQSLMKSMKRLTTSDI